MKSLHKPKMQQNTNVDPKAVPRIVWGLRNLQQAFWNRVILSSTGSVPAAPT